MHANFRLAVRLSAWATLQRRSAPCRKTTLASLTVNTSRRSHGSDAAYGRAFAAARDQPEQFWAEAAQDVDWFQPWSQTLHVQDPVFPNWWVNKCRRFHPRGAVFLFTLAVMQLSNLQFETVTNELLLKPEVEKVIFLGRESSNKPKAALQH